jgi:hypothetical protein
MKNLQESISLKKLAKSIFKYADYKMSNGSNANNRI